MPTLRNMSSSTKFLSSWDEYRSTLAMEATAMSEKEFILLSPLDRTNEEPVERKLITRASKERLKAEIITVWLLSCN